MCSDTQMNQRVIPHFIFKADFWSEMAKEVKSSFGKNGLKKAKSHSRSGGHSSRDGSDSSRNQAQFPNGRISATSPDPSHNHPHVIQNPGRLILILRFFATIHLILIFLHF